VHGFKLKQHCALSRILLVVSLSALRTAHRKRQDAL